jgi:hypothetical protein
MCAPQDPISLYRLLIVGPSEVHCLHSMMVHKMRRGMSLKWFRQQYATCLMSLSESGIVGTTGHSYALTVMVDHFIIFL